MRRRLGAADAARDHPHTSSDERSQAQLLFAAFITSKMDGILTAVKTVKHDQDTPFVAAASGTCEVAVARPTLELDQNISWRQFIDLLKSRPTTDDLSTILAALDPFNASRDAQGFDIRIPSPATAQILQVLVSTTIPDHWRTLNAKGKKPKDAKTRAALLRCLSSVPGIGSLVAQLRSLIATARATTKQTEGSSSKLIIRDILSICAALLEPKDFLFRLKSDISLFYDHQTRQQVAWRELVSLIAGGKVLSTAAEALTLVEDSVSLRSISWVGDGSRYTSWLGGNIAYLISKLSTDAEKDWSSVALLTGRSLSLGYSGTSLAISQPKRTALTTPQIILLRKSTPTCFRIIHMVHTSADCLIISNSQSN